MGGSATLRRGTTTVKTMLVTGGAGFIGSNFTRFALAKQAGWRVVVLDALTYAGNLENLEGLDTLYPERYRFIRGDVADKDLLEALFAEESPELVVHFAAESHVDRSILGPMAFVRTNVLGSATLLDAARRHWKPPRGRFLQVSTDEVYGSLGDEGAFTEKTPLDPSSPYSASKAAADQIALAYHRTYGMDVVVTRCCNNYGPYQFPEKLIPLMITRALSGENLPVYGRGENVRDWIHVEDHNRGVLLVAERGKAGEVYNLGARCERRNIDLVRTLLSVVATIQGWDPAEVERRITFVTDRPGHDWRYAINPSKAEQELGFKPRIEFEEGLRETVRWYLDHAGWLERVKTGAYREFVHTLYGDGR
jgi:dTDP-glucose 4,6-dehydratase